MATTNTAQKSYSISLVKSHKPLFLTQVFLRVMSTGATLGAAWITFANKQTTLVYGIRTDATYTYSTALEFFAYANIITCTFTLLSLVLPLILGRKWTDPLHYFFMFLHDLMMTMLLMAACAAATAVGYLGKYGNWHAGWTAVCPYFGEYCSRAMVATVLAYLGFLFYLVLTITSAYKSRFVKL